MPSPTPRTDTRQRILQSAFQLFYRVGFRGSSLDSILAAAQVTKGALYHHFSSKRALEIAVVDEIISQWIHRQWLRPLEGKKDPLAALVELARRAERQATSERMQLGCPLNNLVQEIGPEDEDLGASLVNVLLEWRGALSSLLADGQSRGTVRPDIDPDIAATFITAAWEGSIGFAKGTQNREDLQRCRRGLEGYLATLEPR